MSQTEPFVLNQGKLQDLKNWLKQEYGKPCYSLVADVSQPITPLISRIGGLPYWDFAKAYPFNEQGEALRFLCQINLSQLPVLENVAVAGGLGQSAMDLLAQQGAWTQHGGLPRQNEGLPRQGLLQFFVGQDESIGCTFEPDNPACKVVYWSTINPGDTDLTMDKLRQRLIEHGVMKAQLQVQSNQFFTQVSHHTLGAAQDLIQAEPKGKSKIEAAGEAQDKIPGMAPNQSPGKLESQQFKRDANQNPVKSQLNSNQASNRVINQASYMASNLDDNQAQDKSLNGRLRTEETCEYWPIRGECALRLVAGIDLPHAGDDNFDFELFFKKMQATGAITLSEREYWGSALFCQLVRNPDFARIVKRLLQLSDCDKHGFLGSLLGYPDFVQYSPLSWSNLGARFDTLLLRLEDIETAGFEMLWCDCGIADFFMNSQALAKCDFSDVFYYWDCG